jgi:hypothetical protein
MSLKHIFIPALLTSAICANAQSPVVKDTTLKGSVIEVIQAYKPVVKQAPKPEWTPQLPPADTSHPNYKYDVPQQSLYYTYSSMPLRPLALGIDSIKLPFQNYIKAGGGNLSTVYLDAGIGGIKGQNYGTAIHLHHMSQVGSIDNQNSQITGVEADGALHKATTDWNAGIMWERNQYTYYGYDHSISPVYVDVPVQAYNLIGIYADMKNKPDSGAKLSYNPAINASFYNATLNSKEFTMGINAPFTYKVDSTFDVLLQINGNLTSLSTDSGSQSNNFLQAKPGFAIHSEHIRGAALVGFALGKGGNGYILPDVWADFTLPNTRFTINAGYQASLIQNSYLQLTTINPFLNSYYNVLQTRKDEVFAGVKAGLGNHLSFDGKLSWLKYNDLATFKNSLGDTRKFDIEYQNLNAIGIHLAAGYRVANSWSAAISCDFYNFYNNSTIPGYVWHQPKTKIKADFMMMPLPKLTVTAYLAMLGGLYAMNSAYNVVQLNTIFDAGCGAEYQVIPRLSVFAQINNLFNQKYERWYGYQSYGLNVFGGLRLKF